MRFQDFKVLSDREIIQIHEASITILENTGVMIHSKTALDLLHSKGANVDYDKKLVKISARVVKTCSWERQYHDTNSLTAKILE